MSDGSQLFDPRDRDEADGTDGAEEIDHGAPALPLRAPSNDLAEPEGGLLMAGPLDPDAASTPPPMTPETVPKAQAGRALVPTDLASPGHGMGEKLVALTYRFGVPGELLGGPPGRKDTQRLRADVVPPPLGRRPAGMALRAGHFLVGGVKAPIGKVDLESRAPAHPAVRTGDPWLRLARRSRRRRHAGPDRSDRPPHLRSLVGGEPEAGARPGMEGRSRRRAAARLADACAAARRRSGGRGRRPADRGDPPPCPLARPARDARRRSYGRVHRLGSAGGRRPAAARGPRAPPVRRGRAGPGRRQSGVGGWRRAVAQPDRARPGDRDAGRACSPPIAR